MKKLRSIKAVFIDIDGTLTNSKKEITDYTKIAIKRIVENGIYVVLCSGRSNKDVCKYSENVHASEYVISSNGAQIYNYKTNMNLYKDEIKYITVEKLWNYCISNNLEIILNSKDKQYGNNIFFSDIYRGRTIINDIKSLKEKEIYQIMINSNNFLNTKKCIEFVNRVENVKINNYSRDYLNNNTESKEPYYIFVNNKLVDKGRAINSFLEVMNIKKEETICFGDRINDITMFNSCGKTIAMNNADEDLKRIANYITLSNDENGVAEFLNKNITRFSYL